MKEDILEQIADDYLQFKGYFTTHNVRFKPDTAHPDYVADLDRVPSDVDVATLRPPPSSRSDDDVRADLFQCSLGETHPASREGVMIIPMADTRA